MASGASSNEKTPDHLPRQNEMSSASPAVEQSAAESSLAAEAQSPQEAADSEHDVVRRGRRTVDFAIAGDQLNDKKPIPSDYETSPGNTSNEHITTRSRSSSSTSGNSSHVDWNQLQKNEDQEARDENSDDVKPLFRMPF